MAKPYITPKLPSLDGWRAVSIALVLLGHCVFTAGFPEKLKPVLAGLDSGGLGVRCFFVISGFLITWLLLQEQEHVGGISIRHFYIRRGLRILPVYFLYLLVLGCLTSYHQDASAWLANVTFTTNFFWTPFPTAHFWSLGVEEQFYLLWPWLLILAVKRVRGSHRLLKMLCVPLLMAPLVRLLDCKLWYPAPLHFLFQWGSFFASFDALAYGCIAAVLFVHHRFRLEAFFKGNPRGISWGAAGLICMPILFRAVHLPMRLQVTMGDSLQASGFTLLLLQSVLYSRMGFYRTLNWRWMRHIGVMSYSIYIWQQMFCGTAENVFGIKAAWWVNFPTWILVTLLVAHVSYYLVEKPLFKLRAQFRD